MSLGLFDMQNEYLTLAVGFLIESFLAVRSEFISAHWLVAEDMQNLYFWWDWDYKTIVNNSFTTIVYTLSFWHMYTHTYNH